MTEPFLFSRRTDWPLTANALTAVLEDLRLQGVPVLDLTGSNPTRCGFSYPVEGIARSLAGTENLSYAPMPRGELKAREAVSSYYREKGQDISPERIFLAASTSEAYSYLFRLLANPSDQVLFPRPSYPLFSFLGDLNDCIMDTYPLIYDGRWGIDLQEVRAVLRHDTKALVLVNPNNPTGSFIHPEEVDALNIFCRTQNTALICDEVFADFAFDKNTNYPSLAGNREILTFVLGGISKTLGLPQMKLSWIVINGPDESVRKASSRLEVIADTYLSVNTPVQNALPQLLTYRKQIQEDVLGRVHANYQFLGKEAGGVDGCELLRAEGGWYAVLKIPDKHSEEEWALRFLKEDGVFVHPGYFFDFEREAFIVISLLPPESVLQEGVSRILRRIATDEL